MVLVPRMALRVHGLTILLYNNSLVAATDCKREYAVGRPPSHVAHRCWVL